MYQTIGNKTNFKEIYVKFAFEEASTSQKQMKFCFFEWQHPVLIICFKSSVKTMSIDEILNNKFLNYKYGKFRGTNVKLHFHIFIISIGITMLIW